MPRFKRLYCEKRSSDATAHLPVVHLSQGEIRRKFNAERHFERFLAGEYLACLRKESVPSSVDEPVNTRSLTIDYLDLQGNRVCRVHMYLQPDGSLGGSGDFPGRPDPKQLIVEGTKYVLE